MNTLDVLEKYSQVCDELDAFMQEENRQLRASGGTDERLASRRGETVSMLDEVLGHLRAATPVDRHTQPVAHETRNRVLQKLLKLLLLSRESEQLLLKNMAPARKTAPVRASVAQISGIYRAHAA